MRASLRRFGIVAALVIALEPAVGHGQSAPPPCPPGTPLATATGSVTDDDVLPMVSDLTATHNAFFDAGVDFSGPPASENNEVSITPPAGLDATTVPGDGSLDVARLQFVAPPSPATLVFTVSWTQAQYPSTHDCTGSTDIAVVTVPDVPIQTSHAFSGIQHNLFTVGWTLLVDRHHGDGQPVTVSARAVAGRRLPDASTPALTSTWSPFHLHRQPLTAHSNLVRLRSATTGYDVQGTHVVDIINASVVVRPPRRGATVRRGFAIDVTQGAVVLARYRIVTTCRLRRRVTCKPMRGGPA